MTEMEERVARAIAANKRCTTPNNVGDVWTSYVGQARAAIEAMKTPTKEMIDVGFPKTQSYDDARCASECWQAMCSAALTDNQPA